MGRDRKFGEAAEVDHFHATLPAGYKTGRLVEMREHFGVSSNQIVLDALEDYWERRHIPPDDSLVRLAAYGVHDLIPDFDGTNFANELRKDGKVFICVSDFDGFLNTGDHLAVLVRRLAGRQPTTITIPFDPQRPGGFEVRRGELIGLQKLARSAEKDFKAALAAFERGTPYFDIHGTTHAFNRVILNSDVAVVSPNFNVSAKRPATVYINRSVLPPEEGTRMMRLGGKTISVDLTTNTNNMWTRYFLMFDRAAEDGFSQSILTDLIKNFPRSLTSQPTPR